VFVPGTVRETALRGGVDSILTEPT